MITFWQQENGKLVHFEQENLDSSKNVWIDARSVTRDDIRILEEEYHVQQEHILDILDPDELSRIEKDDEYTLIIIRLPVFMPTGDIGYFTIPMGIILYPDKILTICWTDCEVLKDIAANRVRSLSLNDFSAFIMRVLSRADMCFLRYLKEINRRSTTIQNELQMSIKNNELIQLLNLEKSLVFFTTSLKSNQLLLEKLSKTRLLTLDEDDRDWLEDVAIDNRQAIEMADTYSNILSGMMDAFASVISNNLNIVMKRLTVISLILMVPTFVVSFFGMNIPLPFTDSGWLGLKIISATCLLAAFFARFLLRDKHVKEPKKKIKKSNKKNITLTTGINLLSLFICLFISISFFQPQKVYSREINSSSWIKSELPTAKEEKPFFIVPGIDMVQALSFVTTDNTNTDTFILGENTQSFAEKRTVSPFLINRYETTYQFWYNILTEAILKFDYEFQNPGQEGSGGRRGKNPTIKGQYEPVTNITWYDAIVWCNAASELEQLTPCYTYKGKILRSSVETAECDLAECDFTANGYRLPTETEWEYAARRTKAGFQRGDLCSGCITKQGESDSSINEGNVAWYEGNTSYTHIVGTAGTTTNSEDLLAVPSSGTKNGLGLFDMSGNVLEFCWDWLDNYKPQQQGTRSTGPEYGSERISRGGSWSPYATYIFCGDRYSFDPNEAYNYIGFRVVRTGE